MTDAEQEWCRLRYGDQIDELKKTPDDPALNRPYKARTLKPDELETFDDCLRLTKQESEYNWFNYWPYKGNGRDDTERRSLRFSPRVLRLQRLT